MMYQLIQKSKKSFFKMELNIKLLIFINKKRRIIKTVSKKK